MAAVRDTLCNLRPVEIPRPKCHGFQFVRTRGRMGFYQSIKRDGEKYGISINKSQGPRRPSLPTPDFWAEPPPAAKNEGNASKKNHPQGSSEQKLEKSLRLQNARHSIATSVPSLQEQQKLAVLSHQSQKAPLHHHNLSNSIPEEVEGEEEPEAFLTHDEPAPDYDDSHSRPPLKQDRIAQPNLDRAPPAPPPPPANFLKKINKNNQNVVVINTLPNGDFSLNKKSPNAMTPKLQQKQNLINNNSIPNNYFYGNTKVSLDEEDEEHVIKF